MPINLPRNATGNRCAALFRCIKHAAHEMGVTEFFAANLMSHFLEQLTDEVCAGSMVRLPGFGMFTAGVNHRSKFKHYEGQPKYCVPKFAASAGFRVQVKDECAFGKNHEVEFQKYLRSGSPTIKSKQNRSVRRSLRILRENVTDQADKVCMDSGPKKTDVGPAPAIPGILP